MWMVDASKCDILCENKVSAEIHVYHENWNPHENWAKYHTIHTAQAYSLGQPGGENRLDEILGS